MPSRIVGLDINRHWISAVRVVRSLKRVEVVDGAWVPVRTHLHDAFGQLTEHMDLQCDWCAASIPADTVSFRNFHMPFQDVKKIAQALPFELETMGTCPAEDMVVDFNALPSPERSNILAAAVSKHDLSRYLDALSSLHLSPGVVDIKCMPMVRWLQSRRETPDHFLFLDMGGNINTLIFARNGHVVLIRPIVIKTDQKTTDIQDFTLRPGTDHLSSQDKKVFFETLFQKVQNSLHAFVHTHGQTEKPVNIYYSGLLSSDPDAGTALASFFQIPAEKMDILPVSGVHMRPGMQETWHGPLMDCALALALGNIKGGRVSIFEKMGWLSPEIGKP